MTNPYEPQTKQPELLQLPESPKRTTRAFRATMWTLGILFFGYIGAMVFADYLRSTFVLYDWWHESEIGSRVFKSIAN